jgi:peptide/nickel transport system permease protein
MDKLHFIGRRLLHTLPVLFGITLVVFLMVRLIPGDPALIILGTHASPDRIASLRADLGLDQPLWRQFLVFLGKVITGDLGTSIVYRRPVTDLAIERVPITLQVVGLAAVFSVFLTLPLALVAALNRNRWADQTVRILSTLTFSMPGFWLGLMLLILFAVQWRVFPVSGAGRGFLDRLHHLFLPALTMALALTPILIRSLRSSVIDVLRAPHVEFAQAKGLRRALVLRRHVLRVALISTVTILALNLGWLIGGSVVIENVFTLPGIGALMVNSIYARDYPVIQGVTLVFGLLVILISLLTDLAYSFLDPRVTYD